MQRVDPSRNARQVFIGQDIVGDQALQHRDLLREWCGLLLDASKERGALSRRRVSNQILRQPLDLLSLTDATVELFLVGLRTLDRQILDAPRLGLCGLEHGLLLVSRGLVGVGLALCGHLVDEQLLVVRDLLQAELDALGVEALDIRFAELKSLFRQPLHLVVDALQVGIHDFARDRGEPRVDRRLRCLCRFADLLDARRESFRKAGCWPKSIDRCTDLLHAGGNLASRDRHAACALRVRLAELPQTLEQVLDRAV